MRYGVQAFGTVSEFESYQTFATEQEANEHFDRLQETIKASISKAGRGHVMFDEREDESGGQTWGKRVLRECEIREMTGNDKRGRRVIYLQLTLANGE